MGGVRALVSTLISSLSEHHLNGTKLKQQSLIVTTVDKSMQATNILGSLMVPEIIPCQCFCSVITDTREWRHFKMLNEVYSSVEEGMFNTDTKSGKPEIFLRPKETVHVPFKFLSFKADHSVQPQVSSCVNSGCCSTWV